MINVIVIGGGPAGMLAAYAAAKDGARVTLLERNEKLGKKLYLTGKGRCNVTNADPIDGFFKNVPRNPKFLMSAFNAFTNADLMSLLESTGLKLKVERGARVFPESDKSSDVIRAMSTLLKREGVKVLLNERVRSIVVENGGVAGVNASKYMPADRVILACGGLSYPSTGSTGDGFEFARECGHTVTTLGASLVPLVTEEDAFRSAQGLSLKNVKLTLKCGKKTLYSEQGEMLFTHFGISGPLVLSASAHLKNRDFSDVWAEIDLKPALDQETLRNRFLREFNEAPNKELKNVMGAMLPGKLTDAFIAYSGINPEKRVNSITKAEREQLIAAMKCLRMKVMDTRPIKEAIITRGGVSVKEINPSTMESKLIHGLYFAGEMIDVDAYTGGYNIQIACSTGFVAGMSAARMA